MPVLSPPRKIVVPEISDPQAKKRYVQMFTTREFRDLTGVPVLASQEPVGALHMASFEILSKANDLNVWGEMPQGKTIRSLGELGTIVSNLISRSGGNFSVLSSDLSHVFYTLHRNQILAILLKMEEDKKWILHARKSGAEEIFFPLGTRIFSRTFPS
jgi:hypothetical protein